MPIHQSTHARQIPFVITEDVITASKVTVANIVASIKGENKQQPPKVTVKDVLVKKVTVKEVIVKKCLRFSGRKNGS